MPKGLPIGNRPRSCRHLQVMNPDPKSRISDIRQWILLRRAVSVRFGEAAPYCRQAPERQLWAEHVAAAVLASRKTRRAAARPPRAQSDGCCDSYECPLSREEPKLINNPMGFVV